ncbi:hypothetical protein MTR_7g108845 [Medicago truncatula]|uniref:Uncharacterized protein n=1 Tax=Medicago truncatula TaxID=3880 RepID=A0A072U5K7_MEDTR|nr:hypothetical protein MTR_7g108845 [Medicago truncatula]
MRNLKRWLLVRDSQEPPVYIQLKESNAIYFSKKESNCRDQSLEGADLIPLTTRPSLNTCSTLPP